jgi:hypothetical protein
MATTFTKNQTVRVKAVLPQGLIEAVRMDENGNIFYRISWADVSGRTQTRWFSEDELESV